MLQNLFFLLLFFNFNYLIGFNFYLDGKFILELASAREGDRTGWISVPRKTYWPPTAPPPNSSANYNHKNESSTSLSCNYYFYFIIVINNFNNLFLFI